MTNPTATSVTATDVTDYISKLKQNAAFVGLAPPSVHSQKIAALQQASTNNQQEVVNKIISETISEVETDIGMSFMHCMGVLRD